MEIETSPTAPNQDLSREGKIAKVFYPIRMLSRAFTYRLPAATFTSIHPLLPEATNEVLRIPD